MPPKKRSLPIGGQISTEIPTPVRPKLSAKKFRADGINYFLTCPTVADNPDNTLAALFERCKARSQVVHAMVARELHEDGTPHFHILLKFATQQNISKSDHFNDLFIPPQQVNIQLCKREVAVYNYLLKDGNYLITEGYTENFTGFKVAKANKNNEMYASITKVTTAKEGLAILKAGNPMHYYHHGDKVEKRLLSDLGATCPVYTPPACVTATFKCPEQIQEWKTEFFHQERRRKQCLFIIGETQLGKTLFARSFFTPNHIYIRGTYNYDKFNVTGAELTILDDITNWEKFESLKAIATGDGEADFDGKYRPIKSININQPCIILCNSLPKFYTNEHDWWEANSTVVYVTDKLY